LGFVSLGSPIFRFPKIKAGAGITKQYPHKIRSISIWYVQLTATLRIVAQRRTQRSPEFPENRERKDVHRPEENRWTRALCTAGTQNLQIVIQCYKQAVHRGGRDHMTIDHRTIDRCFAWEASGICPAPRLRVRGRRKLSGALLFFREGEEHRTMVCGLMASWCCISGLTYLI
jgi:hypothetical protein